MDKIKKTEFLSQVQRRIKTCCHHSFDIMLAILVLLVAAPLLLGQSEERSGQARSREVVRFRIGVTTKINGLLNFGARLTTGDEDDPNTADITLGSFINDLEVSLDRVYLELKHRSFSLIAGKFQNPFLTRTDLVWDDDVNPQGIAASYTFSESGKIVPKITGMLSIIDEHAGTIIPDSTMWGGQIQFATHLNPVFILSLAGAYYDYQIKSLTNADAGDTRSNNLTSDGAAYLSDFNLLDVITVVEYQGLGERYPIRFVGNYVKNLGAKVSEDTGFSLDLYIGRVSEKKDMRYRYGYSVAETDAVLAAFSNDNTTIPTNYKQHTLTVDYFVLDNTIFTLTCYYYKNKVAPDPDNNKWASRLRLNVTVRF
jgi:hypothetical protein